MTISQLGDYDLIDITTGEVLIEGIAPLIIGSKIHLKYPVQLANQTYICKQTHLKTYEILNQINKAGYIEAKEISSTPLET